MIKRLRVEKWIYLPAGLLTGFGVTQAFLRAEPMISFPTAIVTLVVGVVLLIIWIWKEFQNY